MVETLTLTARKVGNSVAIVIPSFYVKNNNIKPGDQLRLQVEKVANGVLQAPQE